MLGDVLGDRFLPERGVSLAQQEGVRAALKDFNTLSGSSTSTLSIGGQAILGGINTTSHITASSNISSSGTITANSININGSSVLTSSPFTAAGISGSFVAASSSFSTRVSASEVVTA